MYQKRQIIDAEVKELLRIMRNSLKFVEDASDLKKMVSQSQRTIEKLLEVIHESSQFIRAYLDITIVGKSENVPVETDSLWIRRNVAIRGEL